VGVTVTPTRRMTLVEAADILGISKEAVRKRVKRGSLSSDKGTDGRVYVYLDTGTDTGGDTTQDKGTADLSPPSDALLSEMRDRIAFLEQEMEAWREESRRKDTIIMNMTEAMKALNPPPAQEESPEPRETPVTATEEELRGEHLASGGAQEGVRQPWWRRWFGA
jgi:hypothetical protein